MRTGFVYRNEDQAGRITKTDEGEYIFRYEDNYFLDPQKRSVSLTLPKTQQEYRSKILFPFFFNLLSEGVNKSLQCRTFQIDEEDYFSLLLQTSGEDTIGAITVRSA
ncbi:hypothetical protein BH11BAC7_BH11BAC7_22250 [soil metagenome]